MSPWEILDLCTGNYPRYIKIEFPTITFLIKSIKFLNGAITMPSDCTIEKFNAFNEK